MRLDSAVESKLTKAVHCCSTHSVAAVVPHELTGFATRKQHIDRHPSRLLVDKISARIEHKKLTKQINAGIASAWVFLDFS